MFTYSQGSALLGYGVLGGKVLGLIYEDGITVGRILKQPCWTRLYRLEVSPISWTQNPQSGRLQVLLGSVAMNSISSQRDVSLSLLSSYRLGLVL